MLKKKLRKIFNMVVQKIKKIAATRSGSIALKIAQPKTKMNK